MKRLWPISCAMAEGVAQWSAPIQDRQGKESSQPTKPRPTKEQALGGSRYTLQQGGAGAGWKVGKVEGREGGTRVGVGG